MNLSSAPSEPGSPSVIDSSIDALTHVRQKIHSHGSDKAAFQILLCPPPKGDFLGAGYPLFEKEGMGRFSDDQARTKISAGHVQDDLLLPSSLAVEQCLRRPTRKHTSLVCHAQCRIYGPYLRHG